MSKMADSGIELQQREEQKKRKAKKHKFNPEHRTERCATIRNQALVKARDRRS